MPIRGSDRRRFEASGRVPRPVALLSPAADLEDSGGAPCAAPTSARGGAPRGANIVLAVSSILSLGMAHAAPAHRHRRRRDDEVGELQEVVVTAKEQQLKSLK